MVLTLTDAFAATWVRSLSYEFFVFQHLLCTLGVIICMFIHTMDAMNSWSYLWAVTAVWGASTLLKWSRILVGSTFGCAFDASIECATVSGDGNDSVASGDGVMQIAVQTPLKWQPGQHVFLRFPTVNPMTSHPFTIASLARGDTRESLMVMVARARDGQTKTLYDAVRRTSRYAAVAERAGLITRLPAVALPRDAPLLDDTKAAVEQEKDAVSDSDLGAAHSSHAGTGSGAGAAHVQSIVLPAMIDGPYGDPIRIAQYPSVLLLAGGIGITRIVPALLEAVETGRALAGHIPLRTLGLVWAVSDAALLPWFAALRTAQHALEAMGVEFRCDLYVTSGSAGAATRQLHPSWAVHDSARANIRKLVAEWVDAADAGAAAGATRGRSSGGLAVAVAACGPLGFVHDASSAAARENVRLLAGARKAVTEVILDEELFAY